MKDSRGNMGTEVNSLNEEIHVDGLEDAAPAPAKDADREKAVALSESVTFRSEVALNRNVLDEAQKLVELCAEADIDITLCAAVRLVRYLDIMLCKNQFLNLTAIREWDKALVLHLVDSLTVLPEFDCQPKGVRSHPFLDMGTGAGLPGIPLAIVRENRKGVLCDSVNKKIVAVQEFVTELGMEEQLQTKSERLEVLGMNFRRAYGCILARAVAALPVLVEYAAPLLSRNGCLIISKGVPLPQEYRDGIQTAEICGLEFAGERTLELPREFGSRTILSFKKVGEPEVALPRPVGEASKVPLI